jgi:hypothetical protein
MPHTSAHRILLLLLALFMLPAVPAAQRYALPEAVRGAAESITLAQLAWDVARLASDEWRGRNTPSPGFDAAATYIADRLAKVGVEPFGDDDGFRQHYDLHESRVDTEGAHLEVGSARLRFGTDFLMRTFATTIDATLPVAYVGHGWVIPSRGIDLTRAWTCAASWCWRTARVCSRPASRSRRSVA